ncbi:hypothetical protein Drorol1_Dr00014685 [Drosera rotundifolia]
MQGKKKIKLCTRDGGKWRDICEEEGMGIRLCKVEMEKLIELFVPSCFGDAPHVRGVNLGGWLVTEGWITPELFQGIPNGDLLDGTKIQLKSVTTGKYLSAVNGGGTNIVANRDSASSWETFKLWRVDQNHYQFKVSSKQFWGVYSNPNVVATVTQPSDSETFQLIRCPQDGNRIRLRSQRTGNFVQAANENSVTADYNGDGGCGDGNPSVFIMNHFGVLQGEYQVTNGWGSQAKQIMQNHWNSFITEDDFVFMSQHGLNTVRVPVGWWIAYDPNPPAPFVGGSLQALDNAFNWAEKHGIRVLVDLHAAPGSQNGNAHSGTRDGSLEWGTTEQNIQDTLHVIDFLANRYRRRSGLYAIELINEPHAPVVSQDSLGRYYEAGYSIVRKYSNCYVIWSARIGPADSREYLGRANDKNGVVIDIHLYNLFSDKFKGLSPQQNIDFINEQRAGNISHVSDNSPALSMVGEWVAVFDNQGASKEDYQRFAQAQMNVYGRATFGWCYWTFKCPPDHWSMKWMIHNGYISVY